MERSNGYDLTAELREMRPSPRPAFAAELDERCAAGFPRRRRVERLSALAERVRGVPPRRALLPVAGASLAALALATAVVLDNGSSSARRSSQASKPSSGLLSAISPAPESGEGLVVRPSAGSTRHPQTSFEGDFEVEASSAHANGASAFGSGHRSVERSAELGLLASPGDVESDASRVVSTVHRFDGIVLRSTTTEGRNAGAYFSLSMPSAKVGGALDALSRIDRVRTRHEATADVTAPTVSLAGRLRESEARVDSLLAQLAGAGTESERQAVEAELVPARHRAAAQRQRLARLHRRVHFSRVEVRIESAKDASGGGSWGVGDALHDAGRILSAAAGVLLIALAILGPLALIALLVWLTRRAWLAQARRRALG